MTIWKKSVSSGFLIRHLDLLQGVGNHSVFSQYWHIRDKHRFFYTFKRLVDFSRCWVGERKKRRIIFLTRQFCFCRRLSIALFLCSPYFLNHFGDLLRLVRKNSFSPSYTAFSHKPLFFTSLQKLVEMKQNHSVLAFSLKTAQIVHRSNDLFIPPQIIERTAITPCALCAS